jgi:hypothetical protein
MSSWPSSTPLTGSWWSSVSSALLSLWRGFVREALVPRRLGTGVRCRQPGRRAPGGGHRRPDCQPHRALYRRLVLLFVATLVASGLAAKLLSKVIKASGLGVLDRMLGMVFGAARRADRHGAGVRDPRGDARSEQQPAGGVAASCRISMCYCPGACGPSRSSGCQDIRGLNA